MSELRCATANTPSTGWSSGFSADEVERVIDVGETIEQYDNGSRLMLGRADTRPVHVVVYEDEPAGVRIVVTAYEPTNDRWTPGFRERRKNR